MSFAGDIEIFVRVVEAGGFSAAARALGMTPSAVSKLVARLEDRLGARLFRRTTRKLSLTQEGETFYRHGAQIVVEIAEAERAVTDMGLVARGTLRVQRRGQFRPSPDRADPGRVPGPLSRDAGRPDLERQLRETWSRKRSMSRSAPGI